MGAIGYLYCRTFINRFKKAMRRPVTYVYLVILLFYFTVLPMSLRMAVEEMGADSPEGMVTVLTVFAFWTVPANLIAYAKRKGLVYRNCDVHFLFSAPVNPKKVLLYAHLKTLTAQVLLNLFVIVCGALLFRVEGWKLAVYFLFFAVKVAGISGAMARIEEGTLWTSTYARDGFFELCWIAAINFLMFSLVKWYSPRATRLMKITLTLLGVQTLAFICLAFSRMGLYIGTYGLTFKRVFTCWFMGVLFITFGLLMAELWKKFNGLRIAVIVGAISFLALAYSDMPAWMTAYNTSFQAGRAVECERVSGGDYMSILYEGREYVPFCAIDPGCRGDYLGYMEDDEDDKVYEFEGYSRQKWIINYLDSGLMNDCMLYKEISVTGSPEGLSSEYEWNK